MYGETGRFPLFLRQCINMVKFWIRIISQPDGSLLKNVYNELYSFYQEGHTNWCTRVKNALYSNGFGDVWDNHKSIPVNNDLIGKLKDKIYTRYMREWQSEVNNSNKNPILRTYKLFKLEFRLEPYLIELHNDNIRRTLAQFRTSSHHLRIETGRHFKNKLAVEDRICLFCDKNEIDDERHLVTTCSFHDSERKKLLNSIDCVNNTDIFVYLMNSKDTQIMHKFGQYLRSCFKSRKSP